MPGPRPRLHLPFDQWPEADQALWHQAIADDDPFGNAVGARLAKTTLHRRLMAWRRFLGFLASNEPDALNVEPRERLTVQRVQQFAKHLAETNTPYSVAFQIDALYGAARTMIPVADWSWLREPKRVSSLWPRPGVQLAR